MARHSLPHQFFTSLVILLLPTTLIGNTAGQADEDPGDPWETPLQELQHIAGECSHRIPGFDQTLRNAEIKWQQCIDSLSPKFPALEEARNEGQDDHQINSTVILEIDRLLHMAICRNTSAYKSCWMDVISALNECEPGTGDASGKIYFALYDDICRDGGSITIENRRKAALSGKLCERDYTTMECTVNSQYRRANKLCLRFSSNVDCDLSSIDQKCSNEVDKRLHAEIFDRVEKVLQCPTSASKFNGYSSGMKSHHGSHPNSFFIGILLAYMSALINK